MRRKMAVFMSIIMILVLATGTIVVLAADDNPGIKAGEIHEGDFVTGGYTVTNDGTIRGDMLLGAQILNNRGTVEGDILGYAMDANITGKVDGNIRMFGSNINITSEVARNVMTFGSTVLINEGTIVHRNAYLYGATIRCFGTIGGKTDIYGGNVTLGGTYEGDVYLHDMTEGSTFTIVPGTVIKGKLTYQGVTEPVLPGNAQIGSYTYIEMTPAGKTQQVRIFDFMTLFKRIVTLLVYYLFALLLFKFFPRFFRRGGDFLSSRPASALGMGIACLGTLVGSLLLTVILLVLTFFLFNASVFAFTGLVVFFFSMVTIIFADLPVSLWLGNIITGGKGSVPGKLAAGLSTIAAVKIALEMLKNIPQAGSIFGVVSFLVNAAIWLLGTGAILRVLFDMSKAANAQAEVEQHDIMPIE